MERQNLNTVDDVLPAADDFANLADVVRVVRQTRNQDKTDPDTGVTAACRDAVAEGDRGSQIAARCLLVRLWVAALHVQEHEVDGIKHLVIAVRAQVTGGVNACVHTHLLSTQEDAFGEMGLHENFTARKRDSALRCAENAAIARNTRQQFRIGHGRAVLHEERIGVVTVQTAQRAAVQEHGHARSGTVNGCHKFP
jgi:hypothetical protein